MKKRRTFKRRRTRADWVYRNDGFALNIGGSDVFVADNRGTYTPNPLAVVSPTTTALILYDSHNYLRVMTAGGSAGRLGTMQAASRAAGRRAATKFVRGMIEINTSAWAINNHIRCGFRIGVFPQDATTGGVVLESSYSMWQDAALGETTIATWANMQRSNLWERRFIRQFGQNGDSAGNYTIPIAARARARLADNECLAIIIGVDQGSVNANLTFWLSTLVSDEG